MTEYEVSLDGVRALDHRDVSGATVTVEADSIQRAVEKATAFIDEVDTVNLDAHVVEADEGPEEHLVERGRLQLRDDTSHEFVSLLLQTIESSEFIETAWEPNDDHAYDELVVQERFDGLESEVGDDYADIHFDGSPLVSVDIDDGVPTVTVSDPKDPAESIFRHTFGEYGGWDEFFDGDASEELL